MLHSSFSLHYLVLFSNERGAATVATPDSNVGDTGTKFILLRPSGNCIYHLPCTSNPAFCICEFRIIFSVNS
jgi:hypothetical protein